MPLLLEELALVRQQVQLLKELEVERVANQSDNVNLFGNFFFPGLVYLD